MRNSYELIAGNCVLHCLIRGDPLFEQYFITRRRPQYPRNEPRLAGSVGFTAPGDGLKPFAVLQGFRTTCMSHVLQYPLFIIICIAIFVFVYTNARCYGNYLQVHPAILIFFILLHL